MHIVGYVTEIKGKRNRGKCVFYPENEDRKIIIAKNFIQIEIEICKEYPRAKRGEYDLDKKAWPFYTEEGSK